MSVVKKEFTFTSAVGDCEIHAISWKPEGDVKACVVLSHGMQEYADRYDPMFTYFAENGFAVYGHDHLGHGQSINGKYPLGYFGKDNECGKIFVEDVKKSVEIAHEENPGKKVILFGHSMGSFVARLFCAKYSDLIDAAVICGTAGPNPLIGVAMGLTKVLSSTSPKAYGKLMPMAAFGTYNKTTANRTPVDWLSYNEQNVDDYVADPLLGFPFSNQGYRDLITMNKVMCLPEAFEGCRNDLPLFFVAGNDDPVGAYGKGVDQTVASYRESGNLYVKEKLYDARHEIHNENDDVKYAFWKDLVDYFTSVADGTVTAEEAAE